MKIALTGALLILLATAIIIEDKNIGAPMSKLMVYFFCLVAVVGVGHFGGADGIRPK